MFVVNDTHEPWRGPVEWEVGEATSAVITPDPDGFRIGLAYPDDGVAVAVPHTVGAAIEPGSFPVDAAPESSTEIGEIAITLTPGTSRTVTFRWEGETNFVHLHCPAPDAVYPPGLSEVP